MSNKRKPYPIKHCGLFDIVPGLSNGDTINGKPVMNTVMFMTSCGGEAKATWKGKEVKISFCADMGGRTVLHAGGRSAVVNLEALIGAALEAGLADEKVDFTELNK